MKNKLGITEREWKCYRKTDNHKIEQIRVSGGEIVCHIPFFNNDKSEANAKLIADAGTTANKCGKLPSELLQENEEMKALLEELQSYFKSLDDFNDAEINLSYKIKQLLTKINQ